MAQGVSQTGAKRISESGAGEMALSRPQIPYPGSHGSSQPSITPVPGDLMLSSDLCGYQACMWCTDIHAGKTFTYMTKSSQVVLNAIQFYLRI